MEVDTGASSASVPDDPAAGVATSDSSFCGFGSSIAQEEETDYMESLAEEMRGQRV